MTVKVMWGAGGGQHWMEAIWFPAAGGRAGEGLGHRGGKAGACCREEAVLVTQGRPQVVALGWCFGEQAYLRSSWNVLDGLLVLISIIDILVSMVSDSGTKILGMLRVLRLLRTLRPLRCRHPLVARTPSAPASGL